MNFKLNKMSRSKQNHTVKNYMNGLPGSVADNLNILNPSMKEILKLEDNEDVDILEIYRQENNFGDEDDPNVDKRLMHVQRLSTRKKEIGKMRSKLINSNTKQDKYQEEVNIDRGKAEKMAENIFKRRLKHMNKTRDKELSKSNSEIMDAKPNLFGSSKSFLVRLSSQGGNSLNKKDNKDNKSENKQNLLNKVNERKADLSPDNYRRRNNAEKPEDKTKSIGGRNNSNSNYISQNNYSSKSYSNIRENKRENSRDVRNNKVEIENKSKNLNNRRGNDQKVDNQNKRTYKNTIPISNYSNTNNQINKTSSYSHIAYTSQTNKNQTYQTNQSNRGNPPNQTYQKIPNNNAQRGNRSNIPLPNPSKNSMRKELSYQKLPENKNDKSIGQRKTYQPTAMQNVIKSNYTRKPVEEHKSVYHNNSSVTVTTVGRRRNETTQNIQSNKSSIKVEPKNQPQKMEPKYQKVVVNRKNGNERAKTEDPAKVVVRRRNNNNENKSINKDNNRKIVVNTSTTSGRRRGPQ